MGRGGDKAEGASSAGKRVQASRLGHLPDAELRKWAKAYNVAAFDKAERSVLLQQLVGGRLLSVCLVVVFAL